MAYVVADLRAAMTQWSSKLEVGPWFVLEHFTGVDPVYRGQPSRADVALAMSFAGHMNIELIQPNKRRALRLRRDDRAARPRFSPLGRGDVELRCGRCALPA